MGNNEIAAAVEAILFASGEPVSIEQMLEKTVHTVK